jgi:hypothetical protein
MLNCGSPIICCFLLPALTGAAFSCCFRYVTCLAMLCGRLVVKRAGATSADILAFLCFVRLFADQAFLRGYSRHKLQCHWFLLPGQAIGLMRVSLAVFDCAASMAILIGK